MNNFDTIREALLDARSLLHDGRRQDKALTALTQLELMVVEQEPVAWAVYWGLPPTRQNSVHFDKESAQAVANQIKSATEVRPLYAAPVAQQYEAGDVASASAQGFRDGVASVTQQKQEPVAKLHDDGYWTPMKTEAGRALNDRLMRAGSPSIDVYAAPVAQQYEAGDMASAAAQGFRDGVASVAQPLLNEAIDRINDMLKDDDGQAYKEARKFVDRVAQQPLSITPAELAKRIERGEEWALAPQQAEAVPAWTTEQIIAVAQPIAMAIAENCRTAPQLVFPHLFLGLKDLLTSTAPQQVEAVPSDVVCAVAAEREACARQCEDIYSWRGAYSAGPMCTPTLEAAAAAIRARGHAAIAQQKGGSK